MRAYVACIIVAFGTNTRKVGVSTPYGELELCYPCENKIEISFARLTSEFLDEAKNRNLKVSNSPIAIDFTDISNGTVVGECLRPKRELLDGPFRNYIFISRNEWDRINLEHRKSLLFHELAHCMLDIKDHSPSGIMGEWVPREINPAMWDEFWAYVANEQAEVKDE